MPSRRGYLGSLCGLVAGAAGCTGRRVESDGTTSPTQSPTATTPDRPDITVEDAGVQYSYRHVHQVDWNDVALSAGQLIFVAIDAPESTVPYLADEFRLVADGERYAPKEFERHTPANPVVGEEPYEPSAEHGPSREGWLCFETPTQLEKQPTLLLETDDGAWEWSIDAPWATEPEPEWEWTADAPKTVAPGDDFSLQISAENVGDGPGVFRGAVNFSHPSYRPKGFEIPLEGGEWGSTPVEATAEHAADGQELTYRFVTGAGDTKLTVAVDDEHETTTITESESE